MNVPSEGERFTSNGEPVVNEPMEPWFPGVEQTEPALLSHTKAYQAWVGVAMSVVSTLQVAWLPEEVEALTHRVWPEAHVGAALSWAVMESVLQTAK